MRKRSVVLLVAATVILGAAARGIAEDKVSASKPATSPTGGCFRSDRTMEDIKEAEAALKEQWQKDAKASPLKSKGGTYTDLNGFTFKYGLSLPAKMGAGAKYPVFIGNMSWTLATAESQAKYPCCILNVYMPETLFKAKPGGFDAPKDYKSVLAAAIKAVIDKLLAEEPGMDGSRIYIEGASKFGALSLISAHNYPDTYAAIVPSVGGIDVSKALVIGQRKIGVWLFYGILDGGEPDFKKAPHGRSGPYIYKALTDAGLDANITIYSHGDHHEYGFSDSLKDPEWNDFTRLRKWLFEQKKPPMTWPVINSPSAALATAGQPFTYAIAADKPAKSFSASVIIEHAEDKDGAVAKPKEDLPTGLSLDPKTGVISGAPKEAGRFFIRLAAAGDKGEGLTTLQLTVKEK